MLTLFEMTVFGSLLLVVTYFVTIASLLLDMSSRKYGQGQYSWLEFSVMLSMGSIILPLAVWLRQEVEFGYALPYFSCGLLGLLLMTGFRPLTAPYSLIEEKGQNRHSLWSRIRGNLVACWVTSILLMFAYSAIYPQITGVTPVRPF